MSRAVILESDNSKRLEILLTLAREMGMRVSIQDNVENESDAWLKLADRNLADDWGDPANDHWDDFFKKSKSL